MIDYKIIDMNTYPRREHLAYFLTLQHPQLSITADVDVTELVQFCRNKHCSFFLTFLHIAAVSADSIPAFRQRIHRLSGESPENGVSAAGLEIREYAQCPTSHTESAGEDLYCYCSIFHHMPWPEYISLATDLQAAARLNGSLQEDEEIEAFYFVTSLPWLHYREFSVPTADRFDSNPRLSWGRFEEDFRGRLMMPLSVCVHHGLVDGIHIAKFFENVRKNITALANAD